MSAPTRRGLLGGVAGLAAAPVAVATTTPHSTSDAKLLKVCAQFDVWQRRFLATEFEAAGDDTPAGQAAAAEQALCRELAARSINLPAVIVRSEQCHIEFRAITTQLSPSASEDRYRRAMLTSMTTTLRKMARRYTDFVDGTNQIGAE